MSIALKKHVTPEEYLAAERAAVEKHEYLDGEVVAMPGSTREHNFIAGDVFAEIRSQLRGHRPCEVYVGDMRVRVAPEGLYTYPDVVAICEPPQFFGGPPDTLLNPNVIVEVLSPSTEAYDRGEKFDQYKRLESLREYVLVAQDRLRVERFARQGDDWLPSVLSRPEDVLRLESLGCQLTLSQIYERTGLAGLDPGPNPHDA